MPKTVTRPDRDGTHRLAFERNKKKIYATQTVCGICGKPVDFSCKFPASAFAVHRPHHSRGQGRASQRPCQPSAGAFLVQPAEERQVVFAGRKAGRSGCRRAAGSAAEHRLDGLPRPLSKAADIKPSSPQRGISPSQGVSDLPVPYCEYFLAKGESTAL